MAPYEVVHTIATGGSPAIAAAADPEIEKAYRQLRDLILRRAESLNETDREWLVVDYFKAQGAQIDERRVGKSQAIIDAEAIFDHGDLGSDIWRIQVKRYQNAQVDWNTIQSDFQHVGEARFCYVSVYGFTDDARTRADEQDVRLMEAGDFTQFLLTGKYRESIKMKLRLPDLGARREPLQ